MALRDQILDELLDPRTLYAPPQWPSAAREMWPETKARFPLTTTEVSVAVGPGLLAGGNTSFNSATRRSMVSGSEEGEAEVGD